MRFIHVLLTLAFAVVVSAAHFKRDPPQLGLDIASITASAQSVYDAVDELSTPDVRAELVILSANFTISFSTHRTGDSRAFCGPKQYCNCCHD